MSFLTAFEMTWFFVNVYLFLRPICPHNCNQASNQDDAVFHAAASGPDHKPAGVNMDEANTHTENDDVSDARGYNKSAKYKCHAAGNLNDHD
jgi:hypothetical protein